MRFQKIGYPAAHNLLLGTLFTMALSAILCAGFTGQCLACGGGGFAPPKDPGPGQESTAIPERIEAAMTAPNMTPTTGSKGTVRPVDLAKGYIPKVGKTRGGAGGLTRKSRGRTTPQITWEIWWARNRYQFFKIKDLYEFTAELYPITQHRKSANVIKDVFSSSRNSCLAAFRKYLDHKDASLRRIAVLALGRMKDADSVERLMEQLQDNNKYVRNTAIVALGIHGCTEARHTLFHIALGTDTACRILGESTMHEDLRVYAILALAVTEAPGVTPILQSIALDESAPRVVRAMAVEGLGLAGGRDSADFLIELSQKTKIEPYLLSYALTSLGKTGEDIALPVLRRNLYSD